MGVKLIMNEVYSPHRQNTIQWQTDRQTDRQKRT